MHFLSPSQITEALAAGLTTLGGGGTGPSEGSKATTVTPGAWHLKQAHRALDAFPVNLLLLGKGNTVSAAAFEEQALAGAGGYKVHEDWGSTPAAVDAALQRGGGVGAAGRPALGLAQRGRVRGQHDRRRSRAAASRPSTSRGPAAGTRRTS